MNRDEVNARMVAAVAGGVADRSQMIDRRVVTETGPSAREALNAEARGAHEYVRQSTAATERDPIEALALEAHMTAWWSNIDPSVVHAARADEARQSPTVPDGVYTAEEAMRAYEERAGMSGQVDDPARGMNAILARELASDLSYRVRAAYIDGAGTAVRAGRQWQESSPEDRVIVEANVLAERVGAYGRFDELQTVLASEIDHREELYNPDRFTARPLSPAADAALEEAARLAGRWDGEDRTMRDAIANVNALTSGIRGVPAINDVDPREVEFTWSSEWDNGQLGLAGMARAQIERAATGAAAAANAITAPGLQLDKLDEVRRVLAAQRGTGQGNSAKAAEHVYKPPPPETRQDLGR
jgi:hypothetical protein